MRCAESAILPTCGVSRDHLCHSASGEDRVKEGEKLLALGASAIVVRRLKAAVRRVKGPSNGLKGDLAENSNIFQASSGWPVIHKRVDAERSAVHHNKNFIRDVPRTVK